SGANAAGGSTSIRGKDGVSVSSGNSLTLESEGETILRGNSGVTIESNGKNLLQSFDQPISQSELVPDGAIHAATRWAAFGDATVARTTTEGFEDSDSLQVDTGLAGNRGAIYDLPSSPEANTTHTISFDTKLLMGSPVYDLSIAYSPDGGETKHYCKEY